MSIKVITAPEAYERKFGDTIMFLAGGITDCPNWQKEVIDWLYKLDTINDLPNIFNRTLVVCNPRRDSFPINDPNAAYEQIKWEYKWLNRCDIFTMNFCESESDQPICMYELGRYLPEKVINATQYDAQNAIVNVSSNYKRAADVGIRVQLLTYDSLPKFDVFYDLSARDYAIEIYARYMYNFLKPGPSYIRKYLNNTLSASENALNIVKEESDDQNRKD